MGAGVQVETGDMSYLYYEAPAPLRRGDAEDQRNSIFLAGSITGATNWQEFMIEKLLPYFNVFNPRRSNFNASDKSMEREQITWEFNALRYCPTVLFYFAPETLAPITLFEYGKILASRSHKTFVCVHPDYGRKNDVLIQTELEDPALAREIVFDLDTLASNIVTDKAWTETVVRPEIKKMFGQG